MASINKVILIGRVGRDPETTFSPNSSELTKFSIATTESYTKGNEKKEVTEWHNIILWNKLSSAYKESIKKGFLVYVEGKLKTNKWTDTNNVTRYRTEIWANSLRILQRPDGNSSQGGGSFSSNEPYGDMNTIDDDDIPF